MPTETYSRVQDLLDIIDEFPDDSVDDADLRHALERGHQRMEARIGKYFQESKRITKEDEDGELIDTVELKFSGILNVKEILRFGRERVPSDDYSVDKEKGEINFDSDWFDDNMSSGDILVFKYVPRIFAEIEVNWAAQRLKNSEIIQLPDDEAISLEVNARRQAISLENDVNRMTGPGTATDGRVMRGTK